MARRHADSDDDVASGSAAYGGDTVMGASASPRRERPTILFADELLLVANKPAWVPIEPADLGESLIELLGEDVLVPPINPIDDDASGLCLFARAESVARTLAAQLADGRLETVVSALVRVSLPKASGVMDAPLVVPRSVERKVRVALDRTRTLPSQAARTEWRLAEAFAGHALLECVPRSCHRHQIRVHLRAAGMPPAVDPIYGGGPLMLSAFKAGYRPSRRHEERPLIARLSLHVEQLVLEHPATGERMGWTAAKPKDLRAALRQLDKYGRLNERAEQRGSLP